ncbi:MAG: MmcQ/YjbR family DNA-binding protein [Pseudomonadota bacterium]
MTPDDLNTYCASLLSTTHVVQWGGHDVWKVGGKVFVIAGVADDGSGVTASFKVTPESFDILQEQEGLRPAPYLASRGMSWIQHFQGTGLTDDELKAYIERSHRLVASRLSKKKQRELGFEV